ncbi:hypothetical protein GobsT_63670 [Gemmata obscuriglobus]|uniref:Uncharacterized protein n=1 Tax=Gemmata obscuriglobus TaxID=114 RepID=A0A2Z3GTN6_9BACT|nr:hypothetical protein [Gemmata obscuriglobus]AWM35901.1 hypothetical protein C1280_02000 [Gemmata obscuriglobus]QEG31545.1 hypothetical protein GobsT_63670 [Gemmata obscuriglobus]VTS10887.1 unnamed protein product [Gemmata obscuriglobus UQM 2246]
MPTFVSDEQLRAQVTAANAMRDAALPDHWDALLPRANQNGYNDVRRIMLGRGMSAAEFAQFGADATTDGFDWNLRFAIAHAFLAACRSDPEAVAVFRQELADLAAELKDADVLLGDDVWAPAPGSARISCGDSDTSGDRFRLDDPEEGRFSFGDGTRL